MDEFNLNPGIILVSGCMFSGKTTRILEIGKKYENANLRVEYFKPIIDKRYSQNEIVSHNQDKKEANLITSANEIYSILKNKKYDSVVIDEIQFLDDKLIDLLLFLRDEQKKSVVCACLNTDFRGEPFKFWKSNKHVGHLMPYSKNIHLTAWCNLCKGKAEYTQRIINGKPANYNSPLILVGGKESYEARCHKHHEIPGKPKISLESKLI